MTSNEHLLTLRTVLQQLHGACERLLQILQAETEAINQRDLNALTSCGETKQAQLQTVESLETQRCQALALLGWQDGAEYPDSALTALWQAVLEQLRSCQDANEVNGALLRNQQDLVQKTLDIMSGGNGPATLYQADGTAAITANKLPIAKA